MRRRKQGGQAIILVVLAIGLVLMGGLGLAIDTGQLYGHRQMAQAAADAAAQAAVLSIYGGTNIGSNAFGSLSFTCTAGTDARTPCSYARLNGFGLTGSADSVDVDFPASVSGVTLSSKFTPAAVHIVISRPVPTTLLRFLGASASKTVKAAATAAIVRIPSPVGIAVLHPTLAAALKLNSGTVQICGGPQLGIQVNSNDPAALFTQAGGGFAVDLSGAGPAATAGACNGTGADFGVFGGPGRLVAPQPWMTPAGPTEHFYQPSLPMPDPMADVNPPPRPASPGTIILPNTIPGTTAGTGDCPAAAATGCAIYTPGYFPTGIQTSTVAIFNPGIYYIEGGASGVGFGTTGTNSDMIMCNKGFSRVPGFPLTCDADISGCCSKKGMLVYLAPTGGVLSVTSHSNTSLAGSDPGSSYKGLLFFGDRSYPTATHTLSAGASAVFTIQGTAYLTDTKTLMSASPSVYQTLRLIANGNMFINGEIIVSTLSIRGDVAARIKVQLDTVATTPFSVDQVALVN